MSKKLSLLIDSSDSDEPSFNINKSYADRYDKWRHKEELQKLKDQGADESSSSESEEEEEVEIEEDFLRTLSLLKSKDPKIYDKNTTFFKESLKKDDEKKPKKEKPLYMKDYERKLILERNGEFSDDEDHMLYQGPSYTEEQQELKESFKQALNVSSDEEDDLLKVKQKTSTETKNEEAEYLLWLKGQKDTISEDTEKDMSYLHKYWNDPKIDEDEKFLKDYILNKRYVIKDKQSVPTYDEITADLQTLSDDEKDVAQQDLFEHKYNFRFEEPDTEFIKRYPRTIGDSLRRSDNRRKLKREEYEQRKKQEKEQKREELKRLKALKRKEIEEKFAKIREVSGYDELDVNDVDMDSDFDPEKHDQKMKELFNDDYYNVEEETKPEFEHDEEIDDEDWDNWLRKAADSEDHSDNKVRKMKEGFTEIENQQKDEPKHDSKLEFQKEMIESIHGGKKRVKKKSLFAKTLLQPKPIFDPEGKSFEDYLEEYYKLDYEDVIGDMPVRFKYRKVVPNNFGLSVDEILAADDKELNKWCSVKKAFQYRNQEEEEYDVHAYKKKSQNLYSKKKIFASLFREPEEEEKSNADISKQNLNIDQSKKRKYSENDESLEEGDITSPIIKKQNLINNETNTVDETKESQNNIIEKNADISKGEIVKKNKKKKSKSQISIKEEDNTIKHPIVASSSDVKIDSGTVQNNDATIKKKRRKRKKKKSGANSSFDSSNMPKQKSSDRTEDCKFTNKKKHFKKFSDDSKPVISDLRLKAFGINPKKFKPSRQKFS